MTSFADKYAPTQKAGNFVANIIREKALVYVLHLTFPQGPAWYVFEVEAAKRSEFEEKFKPSIDFELTDYGTVHYSGWGEEPPNSLKPTLRDRFRLYED